jgi:outer membrane protein assembly factor BamA
MRAVLDLKIPAVVSMIALAALECCLHVPSLAAQTKPAPLIGAIHSTGQKRYAESQVISASGLAAGQVFDVKAVEAATQKLGQSGAFEEVQFKYGPENGQVTVEFVVKEAARFHRCTYDNLVWASAKEIDGFLRGEIPLFDGYAPEGGDLPDEIARSLERFLQKRGIGGQVERVQFGRTMGDRNWEHLYSVTGPVVKVQSISFDGVKGIDEKLLGKEANALVGRNYSLVEFRRYADASFVPIYRERGFLRVNIGNPAAGSVQPLQAPNEFAVQVTFPVEEGVAYDWDGAIWSGNRVESAADLDTLLGVKRGERANGKKLDAGWEAIHAAYGKNGYLEAKLELKAVYDEASRKVGYSVPVTEGPQYRMGEFSIEGTSAAASLKGKWKLKAGDVYDASYLMEFMRAQMRFAVSTVGGQTPKIQTSVQPDRSAHTVAVSIQVQ